MKATPFISLMLASFLGFNSSYAIPINEGGTNSITAYLKHRISAHQARLFFDGKPLATIDLYSFWDNKFSWSVQNKVLSCEKFEEKMPHLYVEKDGRPIEIASITCTPSF